MSKMIHNLNEIPENYIIFLRWCYFYFAAVLRNIPAKLKISHQYIEEEVREKRREATKKQTKKPESH